MKKSIMLFGACSSLILSSCAFFLGTPAAGSNSDGPIVTRVPYSGDFTYDVDTGGTARDVYFVFSSTAANTAAGTATIKSLSVDGRRLPVPSAPKMPTEYGANATDLQRIADFNRTALSKAGIRPGGIRAAEFPAIASGPLLSTYTTGAAGPFTADSYVTTANAHCRAVVGPISVASDSTPRTLVIWVSDAEWGTRINQTMVDAMADRFLKAGADNDIYDWLTTILGPEWGSTNYTELIPFTGEIHILLTDIKGDASPNGGIVGFFDSTNNFMATGIYSASNQKIMFVIDSYMYANDTSGTAGTWSADGYWPKEVFSTLAHEFQHMIHFYQKGVVAGAGGSADVWIDEMCAQLAEDLLAEKMGVIGPRGVDPTIGSSGPTSNKNGRIPIYNQYSYLPLTVTGSFDLLDYSTTYAFGAWAMRNYGGANFLRRVVCSANTDSEAVTAAAVAGGALRSDLDSLIQRWAVAVMDSDRTDMPSEYVFNTGNWFSSAINGTTYKLGSIDFHKYLPLYFDPVTGAGSYGQTPGPQYYTASGPVSNLRASSNVYFIAAKGLAGKKSFEISLPLGVSMAVVVR